MTPNGSNCTWAVAPDHRAEAGELAQSLGVPPIIGRLLMLRGVTNADEGRRFLEPSLSHVSDPFLLDGMQVAVDRIRQARDADEHVVVFGDYDVDGIAGTVILTNALKRFGIKRTGYGIPDRLAEGYGLSPDRVRWASDQDARLLITVDNGTTARESAAVARDIGIDLIVTDHHQLEGEPPDALTIINPKRQDPSYPGADACGAAVAFKLAWALTGEQKDLDLVALGTVADVVPLRGENRDLVAAGLQEAAAHPRVGLAKLAEKAGIRIDEIRADHIAFQLAPRINAAGRLGNGVAGLELLFSDSAKDATRLASELDEANLERRSIEAAIYGEAMATLESDFHRDQRTIVLASRDWHPGVIGIVASRIQSTYYRPVILIAIDEEGQGRGSGRSVHGFNIADALAACKDHLVKFGGHAAAAGLTVLEENIEAFRTAFEAEAGNRLPPGDVQRTLDIDAQVAFSEIDSRLLRTLDQLRPFGHGNPSPVLCTYGVEPMAHSWRELRGGHLRVTLKEGPTLLTAIGFHMGDRIQQCEQAASLDVAFTPQFNTWRGETTIQLVLKDLRAG